MDRVHGGVVMHVHERFAAKIISTLSTGDTEHLIVEIPEIKLLIGVIYRPPGCLRENHKSHLIQINEALEPYERGWSISWGGDFNFPFLSNCVNPEQTLFNSRENE